MDGFQKRLNASVQRKLSFTLSLAILAAAAVAGIFSFVSAFAEAHELQDDVLRQVAQLTDSRHLPPTLRPGGGDEESQVFVQRLAESPASSVDTAAGTFLSLPATLPDGLQMLKIGGETFRVLVKTTSGGERIAVAQEAGFRNEIARDSAWRTVMPLLILIPVLLLIVADLIRKMFRPIAALSRDIDQRSEQALHAIDDRGVPAEIRPFVVAINRLLGRVAQSMDAQRRFVADAAHELRSPLTALSLQAERLSETEMSAAAHERLAVLRQGIERGRKLLDQLLGLARTQSSAERPTAPVSIQAVYRHVLEDLIPLAQAKRIDIGVEGRQDAQLWMNERDLVALVKNLVDNAIRYTPAGGRVDLSVCLAQAHIVLRIRDTGPGIPPDERTRVFDPFYRMLGNEQIGSGLGLAIVRAIADRIGAEIRLGYADVSGQSGLHVEVIVPVAMTER
ncbi:MAG: two-component sensor histidine kinase [Bordetella sp. SCN 67-23]|nr:two-component sensor histidine kinase [Burkholderiales bacterium]ODS74114.1 MAG: two-component sensor histidine kinase [Bordetella sp. SCN 67-23]OJW87440.1 MAG: two-component sensor histidine kinase [Burkholderiales bacterium 67-32]